MLGQLPVSVRC